MGLVIAGAVVLVLCLCAYPTDRRSRRRGHRVRGAGDITRIAREARSDARAIDSRPYVDDTRWTDQARRNRGTGSQ